MDQRAVHQKLALERPKALVSKPQAQLASGAHVSNTGQAENESGGLWTIGRSPPVSCPACSSNSRRHWLFRKNGCDIYRCKECGLGSAEAPRFDPEHYYSAEYFSGQHKDGYSDYLGAKTVLRREFSHTTRFIHGLKGNGRLIEIGCAYGFFLDEAQQYYEVSGIELAEDAAAYCRQRGLNVVTGVANETNLELLGPADVIVLLDVIEHLPDPRETLRRCSAKLEPGGVMLITTGDFGSPLARLMRSRWRLMTPPQHLWFFTIDSMRCLANAAGLTVECLDHPPKRVPLSLILFQLKRMLGTASKPISFGGSIGVSINLFDAMRVVLRKP